MSRGVPDTPRYEAAEGTVFHEMVSDCLSLGLKPEHFRGGELVQDGFRIAIDDEMVESARQGLDFVRSIEEEPGWYMWVETRVDISPWTLPGQFGTSDVLLANKKKRHVITFDWKYGKEPVYAEENDQCYGYTLGCWQTLLRDWFRDDHSDVRVDFVIEQPRVAGAGGMWTTSMSRVLEFGKHARRQAALSQDDRAPFNPGEKQCRWCRGKSKCPAYAEWNLEVIGARFSDLDEEDALPDLLIPPHEVTPERRAEVLMAAPEIRKWLDELHKAAYKDAVAGRPTPRQKLVDGRKGSRAWDETEAHKAERRLIRLLGREKAFTKPALLTPAAAEKLVGRKRFGDEIPKGWITQSEAKPILVPVEDSRKAKTSVLDKFSDPDDDII